MSEYIERKALLKDVARIGGNPWSEWETAGVFNIIRKQPVLTLDDLRPKGRWVEGYPVTCSNCGHSAETLYEDCNIYQAIRTPFCSYCGADMRGGAE